VEELTNLCEFSAKDKWRLLNRGGSRDGFCTNEFHSKCDKHSNNLTIIKAQDSGNIFRGYTQACWDSSSEFKSDPNAFILCLTNKDNRPSKMKIDSDQINKEICCISEVGPSFGSGDISITTNINRLMFCYSELGWSYKNGHFASESDEANSFLAGTERFQLSEIDVYQKV
jgi:hypothetical protein